MTSGVIHTIIIETHLVNIADHNRGEENLRERMSHGVHSGDHCGVHEVDGVAVQEGSTQPHSNTDYHRPENYFKT